jgi:hypothetical protein
MYRVADRPKIPERDELDDQDQSKWPKGLPFPWSFQYLLPMEDQSGELLSLFPAPLAVDAHSVSCADDMIAIPNELLSAAQPRIKLANAVLKVNGERGRR